MKIDVTQSIGTIAGDVPGATAVFESLGIDYSCGGTRSIEDAARAEGIDPAAIVASLRGLPAVMNAASWNDRSLTDLARHLITQHHRFVRDELAVIALHLADVCAAPSVVPADLHSLRAAFTRLSDVVLPHLREEEQNVFPAIQALEALWQSSSRSVPADTDLHSRIGQLVADHGTVAAQLRTIRQARLRLIASNDLPPRCRPILEALTTFEAHLHEYMFLENCILFPRTIAMEEQMLSPAGS